MNKRKLLVVLSTSLLLTGCHQHTFKETWSHSATKHWRDATCEHKEMTTGYGDHTFGEPELIDGKAVTVCTVCGYQAPYEGDIPGGNGGGGSNVPAGDIVIPAAEKLDVDTGLTITSSFTSTAEIHTAQQKEYLSYTGSYKTISTSAYPDGSKSISDPLTTKLEWSYSDSADVKNYSVTISQNADFSGGFEIPGTTATSLEMYNLFLGTNYIRVNATKNDGSKVCSASTTLNVDTTYPRNLYVGSKMTNCRDCGGRSLVAGGTIRQGVLYRTCGNGYNMDNQKIDDEGKKIMLDQLGVKTEINLSDNGTYNFKLDGTKCVDALMDYATSANPSRHHFSRNTENVKNVFNLLADPNSYPVYFHCRIGTDRTGLVAILINGLLGVDLNEIYQDYLFSNFGKIGKKRYIGEQAGDDNILNYMNEIEAMPGANFQEKTYNTLLTIGVPRATLDKVISLLTIGTKPNNNKGQIIVTADQMTFEGTELKTVDKSSGVERSHPAAYATLSNDAVATANVTVASSGSKTIYAYLGKDDSSTSKKIGDSIACYVDNVPVSIPSITFSVAGMGKCSSRMNYYFVKIGTQDMDAGSHKIEFVGLANSMNLGNIAIF